MHPIYRNIAFKLTFNKGYIIDNFMHLYKSKYILRNFTNIAYLHFSSSSIDIKLNRYPYLFGGIDSNPSNQQNHKYSQLIQSSFDGKLPELAINSYRSLLSSLGNNNAIQLKNLLEDNLLNSFTSKPVKQINKDAQINYKICASKCIIGVGSNRKIHELSMMKLGYFQQSNFGLYFCPSKKINQKKLPCLFQAKILYQSRLKLISTNSNQPESSIVQQLEQSHIIQYEKQGIFSPQSPQSTDIAQQFNKYKQKLSWYDIIGSKSKQLGIQFVMDILGLSKDAINWKISDIDGFMNGNHPKIYPGQAKL